MAIAVELIVFGVVRLFGTNAIPHFVCGTTGQRYMTAVRVGVDARS